MNKFILFFERRQRLLHTNISKPTHSVQIPFGLDSGSIRVVVYEHKMALILDQHIRFDSKFYFQQKFSCGSLCLQLNWYKRVDITAEAFSLQQTVPNFVCDLNNKPLKIGQNGKEIIEIETNFYTNKFSCEIENIYWDSNLKNTHHCLIGFIDRPKVKNNAK